MSTLSSKFSPTGEKPSKVLSPKKILRKLRRKQLNDKDLSLELSNLNISKLEAVRQYLGLEKFPSKKATADAVSRAIIRLDQLENQRPALSTDEMGKMMALLAISPTPRVASSSVTKQSSPPIAVPGRSQSSANSSTTTLSPSLSSFGRSGLSAQPAGEKRGATISAAAAASSSAIPLQKHASPPPKGLPVQLPSSAAATSATAASASPSAHSTSTPAAVVSPTIVTANSQLPNVPAPGAHKQIPSSSSTAPAVKPTSPSAKQSVLPSTAAHTTASPATLPPVPVTTTTAAAAVPAPASKPPATIVAAVNTPSCLVPKGAEVASVTSDLSKMSLQRGSSAPNAAAGTTAPKPTKSASLTDTSRAAPVVFLGHPAQPSVAQQSKPKALPPLVSQSKSAYLAQLQVQNVPSSQQPRESAVQVPTANAQRGPLPSHVLQRPHPPVQQHQQQQLKPQPQPQPQSPQQQSQQFIMVKPSKHAPPPVAATPPAGTVAANPDAIGAVQQFHWTTPFGHPNTMVPQMYREGRPARADEPAADQKALDQLYEQLAADSASEGCDLEQPAGLSSRLLPYQKQGVAWMKKCEGNSSRGGMLCDDMGLGKTLQSLALIVANSPQKDQIRRSTLIVVCTLSTLSQWQSELTKHVEAGKLTMAVHYRKPLTQKQMESHDVIFTTYGTIAAEYKKAGGGPGVKTADDDETSTSAAADESEAEEPSTADETSTSHASSKSASQRSSSSGLGAVKWYRIILDEAHTIKNANALTSRAVCVLDAAYRWCLTGTPVSNSLDDLFSLLHFLRIENFSDKKWWNPNITKPIKSKSKLMQQKGFLRLQTILQPLLLRRTKLQLIDGKPIVALPECKVVNEQLTFADEERHFYDYLYLIAKKTFKTYLKDGTANNNYLMLLERLLRVRQACDHSLLVFVPPATARNVTLNFKDMHEQLKAALAAPDDAPASAVPSAVVDDDGEESEDAEGAVSTTEAVPLSSKMRALVKKLQQIKSQDASQKSVIFSQFSRFLDFCESALRGAKIAFTRLDGSMPPARRTENLTKFKTDPSISVFLVTLKAGGCGLNLTEANNCFLLDAWWNPQAEQQAIDRVHRIGQTRPVQVVRFTIKDSIEQRILELQERKKALARGALGGDRKQLSKLNLDDLKMLFRD